jgi:hypothetical protein
MSHHPLQQDSPAATATRGRMAYVFCPVCFPDARPGVTVTALCGFSDTFRDYRDDTPDTCLVCDDLAAQPVLPCGHPGE